MNEEQDSPNRTTRIYGEGMRTRKGFRHHTRNLMENWELYEKPKQDEEAARQREEYARLANTIQAPQPQSQLSRRTTVTIRTEEFAPAQNPQAGGQVQTEEMTPQAPWSDRSPSPQYSE